MRLNFARTDTCVASASAASASAKAFASAVTSSSDLVSVASAKSVVLPTGLSKSVVTVVLTS